MEDVGATLESLAQKAAATLSSIGSAVYDEILTPIGTTIQNVFQIPATATGAINDAISGAGDAAKSGLSAVGVLPWIILVLLVVVVLLFAFKPELIKAFLAV